MNSSNNRRMKIAANIMLVFCAAIWGGSFVAQRTAMQYVGPYTFSAARFLLGACSLLPLLLLKRYKRKRQLLAGALPAPAEGEPKALTRKQFLVVGLFCGLINGMGSTLVQVGLVHTIASKAGFLNAVYIVFVPLIGLVLFHKKTGLNTWLGVVLAMVGAYFLCISGKLTIEKGDLIILSSTVFFALHIQLLAYLSPKVDGIKFVCYEFLCSGTFFLIIALFFEQPSLTGVLSCGLALVYSSVFAVGLCYSMQITAQKYTDATVAALLMSLEAVFSAVCGVLILNETMSLQELMGSFIVMASVVVAQLPEKS